MRAFIGGHFQGHATAALHFRLIHKRGYGYGYGYGHWCCCCCCYFGQETLAFKTRQQDNISHTVRCNKNGKRMQLDSWLKDSRLRANVIYKIDRFTNAHTSHKFRFRLRFRMRIINARSQQKRLRWQLTLINTQNMQLDYYAFNYVMLPGLYLFAEKCVLCILAFKAI